MSTNRLRAPFCRAFFAGLIPAVLVSSAASAPPIESKAKPRPSLPVNREVRKPNALAAGEYLPASKLREGMKGYGLTVFRGAKIERFGVTILGVLPKMNNGKDMILVRLEGGPLTKRGAYGVQGMSGSPVYVNGRIVGAYSAGFAFAREPLGLVTPIEDMLEAWDPDLPQSSNNQSAALLPVRSEYDLPAAVTIGGRRATRVRIGAPGDFPAGRGNVVDEAGAVTIVPLATSVSVAGVPPSRMGMLGDLLAPLGLRAMQGAGGAALPKGAKASPMLPGGAVGVSLATGDLDMTAIGTLTYRRGNKVVAFGHPFTGIGPLDAPLYSAYILDIWPSYQFSFKLGAPVNRVGRVFQDRPFSIGGEIGALPRMVPVAIDIDDRSTKRLRRYRTEILRHPLLTPRIAALAAVSAIDEVHGQPGDSMATVSIEVDAEEIGTVKRTNVFFDPIAISDVAASDLTSLLNTLSANPFYPVAVRSVKMNVRIEAGHDTAQIERIFLKQSRFEPGQTVEVGVVLKPYKRDRIVRTIPVRIPASVPSGALTLLVQAGSGPQGLSIGPGGGLSPGSSGDGSGAGVRQLVRRFTEREKNNEIVARLLLPTTAVSVGGEKLTNLPPAIAEVMRSTRSTGLRVERDEIKAVEPTPFVLSGLQALSIRVARRGASDRPTPAPPPPGEGANSPSGSSAAALGGSEAEDATGEAVFLPTPTNAQTVVGMEPEDDDSPEQPAAVRVPSPAKPAPAKPEDKKPSDEADKPAADAPKPIGRLPGVWRQTTGADFRTGIPEGVTVTSRGDVRLAPTLARVAESNEAYFWSLVSDGAGGVFAGTGDGGLIYRIGADGKRAEFARTGELEVHALARSAGGTLYAGTSPNGRVFKVGSDGKASLFFQTGEKYVLALALAPDGTLYAATGGGTGRVYRIAPDGKAQVIYEGGESHVTALALAADGTLVAGTAPGALVVKIAGGGVVRPTVLYDAAENAISGLGVDGKGNVYAATTGRGILYKIAPDATTRVLYDKAAGSVSNVQVGDDGTVWFASGATVTTVAPDETVQTVDAPSDIQILSVLLAADGKLWASTGNVGAVYALGSGAASTEGTLLSAAFDAKGTARWGTIRWIGTIPTGAKIFLQTRSGDVAEPDATWSDWSRAYASAAGEKIASPPGRYLQYRATLTGGGATPALRTVEAFYLTRNQAPAVAIAAPRGGEVWRGAKTLRWSGTDPDSDTLSYDVQLSSDNGKVWKSVRGTPTTKKPADGARPVKSAAPDAAKPEGSGEDDMLARVQAELDKHPEITPEMRTEILSQAPAAVRDYIARSNRVTEEKTTPSAATGGTRETSLNLDTTKWPDGTYVLRVVASDAAANPAEAMSGERVSSEFRIVNRAPVLLLFSKATTTLADRSVRVEGSALHRLVAVRAVQYRVDGGDWMAAVATDGLFDSSLEPFTLATAPLSPGAHVVEVQAQDEAGNTAVEKTTVQVR